MLVINFVTGFPMVTFNGTPWQISTHKAYNALFTVTNKTSKRTIIIFKHDIYKAKYWALMLFRHFLMVDWLCPKAIISDRDAKFTGAF